ncbi:MAG: cysteine-rich CWC family protein [Motiliproteus sp.]
MSHNEADTVESKAKVKAVINPTDSPVDPSCCPLCGQANECANTANTVGSSTEDAEANARPKPCSGDSATDCWCYSGDIRFSAELIEQVPEAQQRQACICRRCAEAFSRAASSD